MADPRTLWRPKVPPVSRTSSLVEPVEPVDPMHSRLFTSMPAEFRLMCLTARRPVDRSDPHLRRTFAEIRHWPDLLAAARLHHTLPLMVEGLGTDLMAALPREIGTSYRTRTMEMVCHSLTRVAELKRLTRALTQAGIRVLTLKGVPLSQRLYGSPALRGKGDIDLLIEPANLWRAQDMILNLGYSVVADPVLLPEQRSQGQHFIRDIGYRHPQGHVLELHQRLTQDPSLLPLDFESLWRERQTVTALGETVHTLSDRHLALYLCVHGAHHYWERLCWLADMANLLRHPAAMAQAVEDSEAHGLLKPMAHCLWLCHVLLGTDLPATIRANPHARAWTNRFVKHLGSDGHWARAPASGGQGMRTRLYQYTMKGTWSSVWTQIRADLQYPIDWTTIRLPRLFRFLYPALRPAGWLMRRINKTKRGGRIHG